MLTAARIKVKSVRETICSNLSSTRALVSFNTYNTLRKQFNFFDESKVFDGDKDFEYYNFVQFPISSLSRRTIKIVTPLTLLKLFHSTLSEKIFLMKQTTLHETYKSGIYQKVKDSKLKCI